MCSARCQPKDIGASVMCGVLKRLQYTTPLISHMYMILFYASKSSYKFSKFDINYLVCLSLRVLPYKSQSS